VSTSLYGFNEREATHTGRSRAETARWVQYDLAIDYDSCPTLSIQDRRLAAVDTQAVLASETELRTANGEDPSSLEHLRQTIFEEVKKTEMDLSLIKKMMQTTFALRRQTIVRTCPPVNELMDLWPALKMESEELHDINTRRTTVIHALPVYLQEDTSGFFRTCTEESEPELGGVAVALLTVT
ncbi:hypothetical protein KUCAC02_016447, partial [Chaenocephalus aceratus]